MIELIDDLYAYNDWANGRVLSLCQGLGDDQLDQAREMGMGSLRATWYHVLAADQIWMERLEEKPWREFPKDPQSISVEQLKDQLCDVAQLRCELIERMRGRAWELRARYQDSGQNPFDHCIADLLLHIAFHGTHHRAQALWFLKQFDRKLPMGVDYIFYRTEVGSTPQSPAATEVLANYDMPVGAIQGDAVRWDAKLIARWCEYHDWANQQILLFAADLNDTQLRQDFGIGPVGSILGTLQHLHDVDRWFIDTMITGSNHFGQPSGINSISGFRESWQQLAERRDQYLSGLAETDGQALVTFSFGGPDLQYTQTESMVQNLNHGVHHRAQLLNMLRHSDAPIKNIDMLYAIDQMQR